MSLHDLTSAKPRASSLARQVVQDFANFSTTNGSIQGVIWNDTNANGVRETDPVTGEFTEPGLADWTVYLDTNNNSLLDVDEFRLSPMHLAIIRLSAWGPAITK